MYDTELLQRYALDGDQEAFAALVQRYYDLVYSAARRQVSGDAQDAKDVTQTVLLALARKAGSLVHHPSLAAWLYTTTHLAAAQLRRRERRRQARETKALVMNDPADRPAAPSDVDWQQLEAVLDAAMHELPEVDRTAVLLRFFQEMPLAEVGRRLDVTDDAAQKRIGRALDKLRAVLLRRGIASSAAVLAANLARGAVTAAPSSLAGEATRSVLLQAATAGAGAAGPSWLALGKLHVAVVALAAAAGALILAQTEPAPLRIVPAPQNEQRVDGALPPGPALRPVNGLLSVVVNAAGEVEWDGRSMDLRTFRQQMTTFPAGSVPQVIVNIDRLSPDPATTATLDAVRATGREPVVIRDQATHSQLVAWKLAGGLPPIPVEQAPLKLDDPSINGFARVLFTVAVDGSVSGARTIAAIPFAVSRPAEETVAKWRYLPAQRDGQAIPRQYVVYLVAGSGRTQGAVLTPAEAEFRARIASLPLENAVGPPPASNERGRIVVGGRVIPAGGTIDPQLGFAVMYVGINGDSLGQAVAPEDQSRTVYFRLPTGETQSRTLPPRSARGGRASAATASGRQGG